MNFKDFNFSKKLEEGLKMMEFNNPTPIQKKAVPLIQQNSDLIAIAQTGTGKTAAFVLPILDKLAKESTQSNQVNTIIIAPTRELAKQIDRQVEGFAYFTNSTSFPIYGGGTGLEFEHQKEALKKGTDIIICTPGRLLAHLDFNYFNTSKIKHFVLDEADRMLDMGFYDDIIRIYKSLPKNVQILLFSATMPNKIRTLANKILKNPKRISLSISQPAVGIKQLAYLCHEKQKIETLQKIINTKFKRLNQILIFASSIKNVKKINYILLTKGIKSSEMHSGLNQDLREKTINDFKNKKNKILIATDILSRGIDINGIDLVINYEVPNDPEDYIHRIGRTARANKKGTAITLVSHQQKQNFLKIEKFVKNKIHRIII